MRVRLGQELHTARIVELLQLLYDLLGVQLELLHAHTRQRERHLEVLAVLLYHVEQGREGRHIRPLRYLTDDACVLILVIIVVVRAYVEETIALELYYLVYLEI